MPGKSRTILYFPPVESVPQQAPDNCPSCGNGHLNRHGRLVRSVSDPALRNVLVERHRCTACGATFRTYPSGVTRTRSTERVMAAAVVLALFGVSYAAIAEVVAAMGAEVSSATVWRMVQRAGVASAPQRRRRMQTHIHPKGELPEGEPDGVVVRLMRDEGGRDVLAMEVWHDDMRLVPKPIAAVLENWGAVVVQELDGDSFTSERAPIPGAPLPFMAAASSSAAALSREERIISV